MNLNQEFSKEELNKVEKPRGEGGSIERRVHHEWYEEEKGQREL